MRLRRGDGGLVRGRPNTGMTQSLVQSLAPVRIGAPRRKERPPPDKALAEMVSQYQQLARGRYAGQLEKIRFSANASRAAKHVVDGGISPSGYVRFVCSVLSKEGKFPFPNRVFTYKHVDRWMEHYRRDSLSVLGVPVYVMDADRRKEFAQRFNRARYPIPLYTRVPARSRVSAHRRPGSSASPGAAPQAEENHGTRGSVAH